MIRLLELIQDLPMKLRRGTPDTPILQIVDDSRVATSGALFVARPGTVTDGRQFIADAIQRGAVAVVTDPETDLPAESASSVAHVVADDVAGCVSRLAERFHGDPSRRLAVIGVTGTNGKTTVAHLLRQLIAGAGVRCGLIGTVEVDCGDGSSPARLTTPGATTLSEQLARMVENGCRAAILEVSSHALDQGRTAGLHFTGAVFTNLSGDHLDYHGSMEAYAEAKARLFAAVPVHGFAVINADDGQAKTMADPCRGQILTTSVDRHDASCHAAIGPASISATAATLTGPWGRFALRLPLVGRHNVMNALEAAAAAHALGLDANDLARGLGSCVAPPGRLEPVTGPDDEFQMFVDYAHTDDALENVLDALRPVVPPEGVLRVVFGCGGDRDTTKRPRMGAVASRIADDVIITSDNPRTEDPESIVDAIHEGVPAARRDCVRRLVDRAVAIRYAVDHADAGDVVLIAGKGHEDYQIIGTKRFSFDDRVIARSALAERRVRERGTGEEHGGRPGQENVEVPA